ncbi:MULTISPECIES: hypothetical protein [Leptospira]|uniref:hypothetical protein n=1 Tax=Leptospira TaxID=171 RepID=UPI001EECB017|nr:MULTISPECIES: hypothetical protein [Leptospira]MCG6142685.1 hypothetical protein [Leptospira mtsangambouensis]MCW7490977.1 hypothetical protein [Leptospira meyeri]
MSILQKSIILLIIGACSVGIFSITKTKEEKFWIWFSNNSEKLFQFQKDQKLIFDELARELKKIHPDLVFEFGPIINNKRDFVLSADGIKSAFPAVEKLYKNHPNLKEWNFIKFRPRRKSINTIEFSGKKITQDDLKFAIFEEDEPNKIGLIIFINGFNEEDEEIYTQIAYLFLDQIIGEYDVETHIASIIIQGFDSKYFNNSKSITNLADSFDLKINKKNSK